MKLLSYLSKSRIYRTKEHGDAKLDCCSYTRERDKYAEALSVFDLPLRELADGRSYRVRLSLAEARQLRAYLDDFIKEPDTERGIAIAKRIDV